MKDIVRALIYFLIAWLLLLFIASFSPRVGEYVLIRSDARAVFYAAHPELSTEIVFQGGDLLLYRVLSED